MQEQPVIVQKTPSNKKIKWLYWTLGIIFFLAASTCIAISLHVGWSLSHPEKVPLTESPAEYGLEFENMTFMSKDGKVRLSGWEIPASINTDMPRDMTIIFAHGYRLNRQNGGMKAIELASDLSKAGYNIFMFDFRNSGDSEGNVTTVGYLEKQDLLGAVDFMKEQHPEHAIAVIGFSMGAVTAINAAADDERIKAVIADSPFHDLRDYLQDNMSVWSGLPDFPFTPLILTLIPPLTGIQTDEVSPIAMVEQVYPRPILFIHSKDDDRIPHTSSVMMAEKHPDRFQLWETVGATHTKTYNEYPQEYVQRVIDFFEEAIGDQ